MKEQVVSSDSHVMEPADLWTQRLDRRLKDQAPTVVKNEGRPGYSFVAPGVFPFPVASVFAIGKSGDELKEHLTKGYEAARPSGWDPAERLKDQDIDGVAAEVLYTSLGMPLFSLPDSDLQRACFGVYNDWLAEFAASQSQAALSDCVDFARRRRRWGARDGTLRRPGPSRHPGLRRGAAGAALLFSRIRSVLDRGRRRCKFRSRCIWAPDASR